MASMRDEIIKTMKQDIPIFYNHYLYASALVQVEKNSSSLNCIQQIAPNIKNLIEASVYDSKIMVFARLYDDYQHSNQTKSISGILKKIQNNSSCLGMGEDFENQINEFLHKIETDEYISKAVKLLKTRRDTMLAHNDKKYFDFQSAQIDYFPNYYLWFLCEFTKEVLEYLGNSFGVEFVEDVYLEHEIELLKKYRFVKTDNRTEE